MSQQAAKETLDGTEWYLAPELIEQFFVYDKADPTFKYTPKCDVWACGAIFCLLVTGNHPLKFSSNY